MGDVSSGLEMATVFFLNIQKVSHDILHSTCFKGSPVEYKSP